MRIHALGAVLVLTTMIAAQQPNVPGRAVMEFNGTTGAPFPVRGVSLGVGASFSFLVQGAANLPFITYQSQSIISPSIPALGGHRIDIDPLTAVPALDGLRYPQLFSTAANGEFSVAVPLDPSTPLGLTATFQTLVADPTRPEGASLTAATEIVTGPGITTQSFTLGDDASALIDLSQAGLNFSFYGTPQSRVFLISNGSLTFNSADTGFTPTPQQMFAGVPRIATFWTDLVPTPNSITTVTDQSGPIPTMEFNFNSVPTFNNLSRHTFSTRLTGFPLNTIEMSFDLFNQSSQFTQITGITPGGSRSPTGTAEIDLSATRLVPYMGVANESLMEWFGRPAMPNWPAGRAANGHDLAGMTLTYTPFGPGEYFLTAQ